MTDEPQIEKPKAEKPTVERWAYFRSIWERDPAMDFGGIAKLATVSRQAIRARAKREGWTKAGNNARLARAAHAKADKIPLPPVPGVTPPAAAKPAPKQVGPAPPPMESFSAAVEEAAVDARTKILLRHRSEWDGARKHVYTAINNSDFEKAKLGKITAEALKIVQDGERKAWGLDEKEPVSATPPQLPETRF